MADTNPNALFSAEEWVRLCNSFGDLVPTVCMEECAELIQAISKVQRSIANGDEAPPIGGVIEELADVIIAMNLLQLKWDIDFEKVEEKFVAKIKRNIERTEGKQCAMP